MLCLFIIVEAAKYLQNLADFCITTAQSQSLTFVNWDVIPCVWITLEVATARFTLKLKQRRIGDSARKRNAAPPEVAAPFGATVAGYLLVDSIATFHSVVSQNYQLVHSFAVRLKKGGCFIQWTISFLHFLKEIQGCQHT